MSFLQNYINDNYANGNNPDLPALDTGVKNRLEESEKNLDNLTPGEDKFADVIKDNAEDIAEIIKKTKEQFTGWKPTVGNFVSGFRFIVDISTEVVKIVNEVSEKIVPAGSTKEQAHQAKIEFGKELTFFIYTLWDQKIVNWIPRWIEKKVIYWISGMIIDWALDKIEGNSTPASAQLLNIKASTIKKGSTRKKK
ncbi:MAG: hypothetical protein WC755_01925 [Candidatus Woesearchaeota archaeon]|jgi:hypothetical protein